MKDVIDAAVKLRDICTRHGKNPAARGATAKDIPLIEVTFEELDFLSPSASRGLYNYARQQRRSHHRPQRRLRAGSGVSRGRVSDRNHDRAFKGSSLIRYPEKNLPVYKKAFDNLKRLPIYVWPEGGTA